MAQRVGAYAGEMSQLSRMHGVSLREKSLNAGMNSRVKSKLIVISTQRLPERTAIALLVAWPEHLPLSYLGRPFAPLTMSTSAGKLIPPSLEYSLSDSIA